MKLETIQNSLINGQRRQMVEQIDEYGSDFWSDYAAYLADEHYMIEDRYAYYVDATSSYAMIKAI